MFERVLVSTDGSEAGNAALPVAAALAGRFHSALTVAHVAQDPLDDLLAAGPVRSGHDRDHSACMARGTEILKDARLLLAPLEAGTVLLDGRMKDVAECLRLAAETLRPGVIVMSTHGRGGLARLLLGSVAGQVLRRVSVPVLLVRPVPVSAPPVQSAV